MIQTSQLLLLLSLLLPAGAMAQDDETAPKMSVPRKGYTGATELKAGSTEEGKTYQSIKTDENALLISTKEAVTISRPTISKTGSSDGGDNCSFYGVNAALLVKGGSTTTITGGTITSNGRGANGIFSYGGNGGRNGGQGDGTNVIIEGTTITTTGDGSGGIMTTGGGVTKAMTLTVTTSGRSSAPIRTDRGGGKVTVEGGSFNGCISDTITNAAGKTISTETGTVNVTLGSDCTWMLTADTYITSFTGDASCIKANGYRLFVNNKEMKL